jgi:hypothetical protein
MWSLIEWSGDTADSRRQLWEMLVNSMALAEAKVATKAKAQRVNIISKNEPYNDDHSNRQRASTYNLSAW